MNKEESTESIYPTSKVGLLVGNTHPSYMLHFHKEGKEVGSFDFNEGKMHFEGDLTESGQIFVDWVMGAFKQRLEDAVKAEREACAYRAGIALLGADRGLSNRVDQAIRARGQA